MKIYILPLDNKLRPEDQSWRYPKHSEKFGVEQDFSEYLQKNPEFVTNNPGLADWHYLGIYWTRWHINHDFAKTGLDELQEAVDKAIINDKKTFTICQYDDGPVVNTGNTVQFLASRKTPSGFDIPLLCSTHRLPLFRPWKKYLASFAGHLGTHEIRKEMFNELRDKKDVLIFNGNKGSRYFIKTTLQSYVALAPRGYGGSSFRFFEIMQLGVAPFLIGEPDTRPFKDYISYDDFSLYTNDSKKITELLNSKIENEFLKMGKIARKIYKEKLAYQKWCQFVIKKLSEIKQ